VVVRRGDLVESLGVIRTDGSSEQATVLRLAHALSARVEAVLAGKITTPAVNVPAPPAKTAVAHAVKIDTAALAAGDLDGAKVTRAEYVKDNDTVAAYEREFDSVKYGSTRLLSAENDVSLYASAGDAKLFVDGMGGLFDPANPSFKSFIRSAF